MSNLLEQQLSINHLTSDIRSDIERANTVFQKYPQLQCGSKSALEEELLSLKRTADAVQSREPKATASPGTRRTFRCALVESNR